MCVRPCVYVCERSQTKEEKPIINTNLFIIIHFCLTPNYFVWENEAYEANAKAKRKQSLRSVGMNERMKEKKQNQEKWTTRPGEWSKLICVRPIPFNHRRILIRLASTRTSCRKSQNRREKIIRFHFGQLTFIVTIAQPTIHSHPSEHSHTYRHTHTRATRSQVMTTEICVAKLNDLTHY